METETMPVISTGHVSKKTDYLLSTGEIRTYMRGPYGWILYVHPDQDLEPGYWPEELAAVADWARKQGFEYVLFDRDADTVEGLPIYGR